MNILIYLVEDDMNIRELETFALKSAGFEVEGFEKSSELFAALEKKRAQLVVLDIMLPEEDGLSILKKLRSDSSFKNLPVMMVTAKSTEMDTVRALDFGADDYMQKPFGVMEFISRVKALLRRSKVDEAEVLSVGKIMLNDGKHVVTSNGKQVELTYKEYELLKYLMINVNIVLSREKIMNAIWGYDFDAENRTVDVHIQTLRKKLGECGKQIGTVRNVGYKLSE